jgi:hypothetical protein
MKIFILVLILMGLAALPSMAAEKKPSPPVDDPMVPKIDKTFWRKMAQTDAESTSPCIGSRESPICVVETHLACHERSIYDLCRYAMGEIDKLPERHESYNPDHKWDSRDYMVWYARRVTKRELPWPSGPFDNELPDVKANDVTMVILFRYCFKGGCYPHKFDDPHPHQYVMRKTERGWIMTYWFDKGPIKKSMPFYYAPPKKK